MYVTNQYLMLVRRLKSAFQVRRLRLKKTFTSRPIHPILMKFRMIISDSANFGRRIAVIYTS